MKMTPWVFVCLLGVASFAQPPGDPSQWKLVFSDDFEGTTIDSKKWNVRTYESYWENKLRPGRVKVQDGKVIFSTVTGEGGLIDTEGKFTIQYHYIEARTRLSSATNKLNVWPAFWLKKGFEPAAWKPEYDIAEYIGGGHPNPTGFVTQATHFDPIANSTDSKCHDGANTNHPKEQWGVFGVLIDKGKNAKFYANGNLTLTTKCPPQDGKTTIIILHHLAAGGSSAWPNFECDWVRVYERVSTTPVYNVVDK